ncbi:MAG: DUF697 domain-containing protein [Oscillospiraceae bacterium]|nr:DUF697 domain-containing protein [Oscillospiraceae bacterium]
MANEYEDFIRNEWEKFAQKKLLPNIMLLGATGCGKSSLINLVFQKELARVNDVARGTEGFETYPGAKYGLGVNLIDSRGYEMEDGGGDSFSKYFESVKTKMAESRKKDPLEKIHIIWFCVSVAGEKIQDYDLETLRLLREDPELKRRVVVIATKCDEDDEDGTTAKIFRNVITEKIGNNVPMFEVSTDPSLPLDLEKLMAWSADQLDDKELKEAFVASQMISLDAKWNAAAARIAVHAGAAATIGATPIPVADAALLVPLQLEMSVNLIHLYGMENLGGVSKAVISNIVVTNLGRSFAGGLLKLVPITGQLIGGAINAGVAALITTALGFAISTICYESCKKIARGEEVDTSTLFSAEAIASYTQQYIDTHK